MSKAAVERLPNLAVAYVRMSTEHQQYSTTNQMDRIQAFAKENGFEIVRVYSDDGRSGLNIEGRDELARMIEDVRAGEEKASNILVYDVSRWGRFQDTDESAHYEFVCRQAGVRVHYCAEQFVNDGTPVSAIIKSVKRTMAAEYSRELSCKVFQGACKLIQLGFKQGGAAGFGLRRMLVDIGGKRKGELRRGEQKSIQTDRVILVAGPEAEVREAQWMYRAFAVERKTETEIAAVLNARGVLTDLGRRWTRATVHQVLTNEKYLGNNVYNRRSFKLKQKHVVNAPKDWVRADGVFERIIEPELFCKAQEIILARSARFTDEELLEKLRGLWKERGRISGILIDEAEDFPSSTAFRHRFGSLVTAYRLIGYDPHIDYSFIEVNRQLRKQHPELVASVVQQVQALGAVAAWDAERDLLVVNDELLVSVVLCRHTSTGAGASRWVVRLDAGRKPDITIAVRMDAANEAIRDYYLLPGIDMTWENLRLAEENGAYLDAYRFATLDYFFSIAERVSLEEAV